MFSVDLGQAWSKMTAHWEGEQIETQHKLYGLADLALQEVQDQKKSPHLYYSRRPEGHKMMTSQPKRFKILNLALLQ